MMEKKKKSDLCEELMVEILSRLPTKSLVRFRSVSKALCGLISSPDFIRLHSARSPKKFTMVHRVRCKGEGVTKSVYTINSSSSSLSYPPTTPAVKYPFKYNMNIVGSCNGILCVYEYDTNIIHLWNPSIRRKVTISSLPSYVSRLALGFGFDPKINDYKILWTARRKGGSFVYTMKTHTWREIAASPAVEVVDSPLCLFNEALHWAVKRVCRPSSCYMMAFHLSSEVFSTIELPNPTWKTNAVTVIKGCLAVLSSKDNDDEDTRIWVRTAAGSWSLAFKWNNNARQPLRFIHGDLLFSCYPKKGDGIIDYHHPHTGAPSRLVNLTDSSYVTAMITCIESLELLDTGTSCDQGIESLGLSRTGDHTKRGLMPHQVKRGRLGFLDVALPKREAEQ